ncbi:MAG: fibrobacter succinogenes major paralogous domain-containing protein [Bacteroidetes bacterium]|nr:fibrobacter succinogenes major paralogous domain-containing protein [Bacteroidota bacterium]
MKKKGKLIYLFLILGVSFIFSNSCKKSSDSGNNSGTVVTVTDIDGNVYPTVIIGTQTWMAANLKTTRYRTGDSIPHVADSLQWVALTTAGYCNINNDPGTVNIYGRLYNWAAVTDSKNIAPAGWHVPTDAEWTTLLTYLGSGAGGKLKSTGTTYWNSPNAGATNATGFSGLPGGDRSSNGLFHYKGIYGCFWCTTEFSATDAWEHVLSYISSNVTRMSYSKGLGLSVRCVKD